MRIQRHNKQVNIWASARDTYDWANKPGASWPCSTIADKRLFIGMDDGDLVEFTVNGRDDNGSIDGHELTAFIDDIMRN